MKSRLILLLAFALAAAAPAFASQKLATEKQCMQCHKLSEDFAGPSFHSIAQKWKGKRGAVKELSAAIQAGSGGKGEPHWHNAKMPDTAERPAISPAQARTLARWVLTQ